MKAYTTMHRPRIIIVGAGIAGISAANHLYQSGLTDVTLLEAANRIGGRIHTVSFGDGKYPVELGANFIHGPTLQNSTFRVAESIGILNPYRLKNRMSARFMREDGTEIDRCVVKDAIHIHNRVLAQVQEQMPRQMIRHANVVTFAPLIYENLEEEIRKIDRDEPYKQDLRRAFNAMLNFDRLYEGDELEKITWESEDWNIPAGGDLLIPGGYVQVLQHLLKVIPENSVKLNMEVVRIDWNRKNRSEVEVITKDGSKFNADHVIVTCSLGYLKKHHETLFTPPLPTSKVNIIKSLELGRVNKIFLEFDRPVLAPSHRNIFLAWDDKSTEKGWGVGANVKWYRRIFGFDLVMTKNNTLLGWISGDGAEYMEKLSDDEIGKTCVQLLRQFLNDATIPEPKNVLVTRWCSNPYTLGAYTYQTLKAVPGERTKLSEPLTASSGRPLVQFAGEAITNSCTHGARDSGLREADRLIKLYTQENTSSKL